MQINTERLSAAQLTEIDNRMATRDAHYTQWRRYMLGDNPAIRDAPMQEKPDNRVPVPFARKIVRTLKGYMFKPGYITYSAEGDYIDTLKAGVFDANDEELLTAEIAQDALSAPESYELLRVGERLPDIKLYHVPYNKGYPIYDTTLARNLVAFVHVDTVDAGALATAQTKTVYYADTYETYQRTTSGGQWVQVDEPRDHPFGAVPVSIYRTGSEGVPVFDCVIPLINEHDKIISSAYANERERFANSLLILLDKIVTGTDDEKAETMKQLSQNRILQNLGRNGDVSRVQDAVAFLTKPSRGADVAEEADRLERLVYDMAMVINPTDDTFSASSGIALKYKLLPMEFLASDIEAYFSRGLQRRIELIGQALNEMTGITPETVTIHWRRSLPPDLTALAVDAMNLQGLLSKQTVLRLFPADIVPNIAAELDRIAVESDPYGVDDDS